MKKIILILIFCTAISQSQNLEIGIKIGETASSIDDADFFNDKPSIGKKLWNMNYGINAIYFFKDPKFNSTSAIVFEFNNRKLGVKSRNYKASYEIDSKSIDLIYRMYGPQDNTGRFFLDIGLGVNFLSEENIYYGNVDSTIAFDKLNEPLDINNKDFKLILGFGYDFIINKNFVTFFQMDACGGFTNINKNSGSFINTYFSLNTGLRYIINLKSKK